MKPDRLKIQGLNNFADEQIIDFGRLLENGIFGIFGATGSGKTTVIDAVTLALYGKISRYDGDISRDFINTESENAKVVFEFSIKNRGEYTRYSIERQYARNGNSPKLLLVRFMKILCDGSKEIISSKTREVNAAVEEIIGLGYTDFVRSVVLPQGKFNEFLLLKNNDKRLMLERIFNFERFGRQLLDSVNFKKNEQQNIVANIYNELQFYEGVNRKTISENKKKLDYCKKEILSLREGSKVLKEAIDGLEQSLKRYNELENEIKVRNSLMLQTAEIEQKRKKLNYGRSMESIYPEYEDYIKTTEEIKKTEELLKEITAGLEKINIEYEAVKREYTSAASKKNDRLPVLLSKRADFMQAVQLEKDSQELKAEINKLLNKQAEYKAGSDALKLKLDEGHKEQERYNARLKDILEKKRALNVNRKYADDIEAAAKAETNAEEQQRQLNKEILNRQTTEKEVQEIKFQLDKSLQNIEKLELTLSDAANRLDNSLKLPHYSADEISAVNMELSEIKSVFKQYKQNIEALSRAGEKCRCIEEQKNTTEEKIKKYTANKNELNKKLEAIEEQAFINKNAALLAELAAGLNDEVPCPLCGAVHHPKLFSGEIDKTIIEERNHIKTKLDSIKSELEILMQEYNSITVKLELMADEKAKLEKTVESVSEDKLQANISEAEKKSLELKQKNDKYENERQCAEQNKKAAEDKLNSERLCFVSLKSEYKNKIVYLDDIIKKIESIKNKYQAFAEEKKIFSEAYDIECFAEEYCVIKDKLMQREKLEEAETDCRLLIQDCADKIEVSGREYEKYIKLSNETQTVIFEKNQVYYRYSDNITKITGGKPPKELLNNVTEEITAINERAKKAEEAFNFIQLEKQRLETERAKSSSDSTALDKLCSQRHDKLEKTLSKLGLKLEDDLKRYILNAEEQNKLDNLIKKFDFEFSSAEKNIALLSEDLKEVNRESTVNAFNEKNKRLENVIAEIEEKNKDIIELNLTIEKMSSDLSKADELNKRYKAENYRLSLLMSLSKTLSGNTFVEYLSIQRLKYIAAEAGRRFSAMSGGRYSFALDGADFVVIDHFNAAVRRMPKSLSGGEMFMASLSLALALSSKIQLKNNAPLEIFFLDEGFGTLDAGYLDAVVSSLEELKRQNVCVGIITHVDELKNRIQSKIIIDENKITVQ